MNENRMHRAVSDDGTEIVGTVHGQGPPLILQHGAMDHGEISWGSVLPYLTHRYTCHVPSLRNRGRSGHSDDSMPPRLVEDLTAYVASLGQPAPLVGLSLGGALALEAAHRIEQVTAVVAYEPAITAVIDEETRGLLAETVVNEARAVQEGRLADGVRRFGRFVGNHDEVTALEAAGAFEIMAPNAPADLAAIEQGSSYTGPRGTDPDALARLEVPVLLLQGARSNAGAWFHACVEHVASHVPQAEIRQLAAHGHLAPMVDPEPVADEVLRFLHRSAAAVGNDS
jgi:pimeloyl-ACP methyl ester carboxylesterase